MPKAIAGFLFDKDGTLLDYDKSWAPVNRQVALVAAKGDEAFANRLLHAIGQDPATGVVVADSLLAAGNAAEIAEGLVAAGSTVDLKELTQKLDALFSDGVTNAVPVTDLLAFFSRLKARGLKLGIASSDNEKSIRATAERFGFAHLIDFVAGYDSGHGVKPSPGMIHGFCAATGLAPSAVAMVGDNNHDMHMGRNAKVGLTIGVLTGTGSRQSLSAAADMVLDNITDIEPLLG